MITKQELDAAIAECLGERMPDAKTCQKLATYYIIRGELFGGIPDEQPMRGYSTGGGSAVEYTSDTEFGKAIQGMPSEQAWKVIDDLMSRLAVLNVPLYKSVMRRLDK